VPTVRTRFQPTVDLDVPEAEAAMLRAQGLLVEPEPEPEPEAAATEAAVPPPAATKTPASKASAPVEQAPASDDTKGE